MIPLSAFLRFALSQSATVYKRVALLSATSFSHVPSAHAAQHCGNTARNVEAPMTDDRTDYSDPLDSDDARATQRTQRQADEVVVTDRDR